MHRFPVRVYYEDTDLAGIVYYANYLKFIERGRSEWLREIGIDQLRLKERGIVFAVRRIEADYLAPARFDDALEVVSRLNDLGAARISMCQKVTRAGVVLFSAVVTLVCVSAAGRPVRIPAEVGRAFPDEAAGCN